MPAPSPRPIPSPSAAASVPSRNESILLWLGLAIAFSPTLFDLARHWIAEPWARYALVFPLLFARCVLRGERESPRPSGSLWIAAGLALEIVFAFAGRIRWARPGLALAAFGVCRRQGLASWRAGALLFFAVPAPAFLVRLASPELSSALLDPLTGLWRSAGLDVVFSDGVLRGPHGALVVRGLEGASVLPLLIAGLAWYDRVLRGRPLSAALATGAALAALAVAIQVLALALAVGATAAGGFGPARALLAHATWIALTVIAVATTEWRSRRA